MDPVADVLEHFGTKGMKWGVRKDESAYMSTATIITNQPPKVNAMTVDGTGKPAVVLAVNKASEAEHIRVKSLLKRDLHSYEKVVTVTTINEAQALAYKADKTAAKKRSRMRTHIVDIAQAIETIASFALRQSDETVEDVIEHYGVRGMKWGVRKKKTASGPNSADAQQVKDIINNIHKNGIGAASNADLKVLEGRAKLENKYKDIYPKKKTVIDHGLEIAKRVLIPVAEQQAKAFLNDKAAAALKGKEIVEAMEIGRHSIGGGRHLKKA